MNEEMKAAWLEISQMLGEPTREELNVFLRTWQRASQATREALTEQPAQPMHPEIKKMYEDYFDKCFRESSAAVPENFMDALKFDVAMRECVMEPAQDSGIVTAGGFDPRTQRTWVGLTDEEYINITDSVYHKGQGLVAYYKAIEAKLKEKNNG